MKRWMIGGGAIALLTGFPAPGQSTPIWLNQPQYQPRYRTQHQPQHQYQYQPRYLPQVPVLQVTPSNATIQIYLASPYSNRSRYPAPYRQSVPVYPAASTYHYPTPTHSTSIYRGISVPLPFMKRSSPRESRFSQPYPRQTIYPVQYPIGVQTYPIYSAPYRR